MKQTFNKLQIGSRQNWVALSVPSPFLLGVEPSFYTDVPAQAFIKKPKKTEVDHDEIIIVASPEDFSKEFKVNRQSVQVSEADWSQPQRTSSNIETMSNLSYITLIELNDR